MSREAWRCSACYNAQDDMLQASMKDVLKKMNRQCYYFSPFRFILPTTMYITFRRLSCTTLVLFLFINILHNKESEPQGTCRLIKPQDFHCSVYLPGSLSDISEWQLVVSK